MARPRLGRHLAAVLRHRRRHRHHLGRTAATPTCRRSRCCRCWSRSSRRADSWRALPPPGTNLLVSVRKLPERGEPTALHPLGTLQVSQRFAPLDAKLDRVGAQRPVRRQAVLARRGQHDLRQARRRRRAVRTGAVRGPVRRRPPVRARPSSRARRRRVWPRPASSYESGAPSSGSTATSSSPSTPTPRRTGAPFCAPRQRCCSTHCLGGRRRGPVVAQREAPAQAKVPVADGVMTAGEGFAVAHAGTTTRALSAAAASRSPARAPRRDWLADTVAADRSARRHSCTSSRSSSWRRMTEAVGSYTFLPWLRQGIARSITAADGDPAVQLRATRTVELKVTGTRLDGRTLQRPRRARRRALRPGRGDRHREPRRSSAPTRTRGSPTSSPTTWRRSSSTTRTSPGATRRPRRTSRGCGCGHGSRWSCWRTPATRRRRSSRDAKAVADRPLPFIAVKDFARLPAGGRAVGLGARPRQRAALARAGRAGRDRRPRPPCDRVADGAGRQPRPRLLAPGLPAPPRRRTPRYHAFLVPTFERGRLAGLGIDPDGAPFATASAWADYAGAARAARHALLPPVVLPHRRRGDFESLVRLLKSARPSTPGSATATSTCRRPARNLPGITTPTCDGVLRLGGALRAPFDHARARRDADGVRRSTRSGTASHLSAPLPAEARRVHQPRRRVHRHSRRGRRAPTPGSPPADRRRRGPADHPADLRRVAGPAAPAAHRRGRQRPGAQQRQLDPRAQPRPAPPGGRRLRRRRRAEEPGGLHGGRLGSRSATCWRTTRRSGVAQTLGQVTEAVHAKSIAAAGRARRRGCSRCTAPVQARRDATASPSTFARAAEPDAAGS